MHDDAMPFQHARHPSTQVHHSVAAAFDGDVLGNARKAQHLTEQAELFARFDELPMGMALNATVDPTELEHGGRIVANFGTNNYLATTHHPDVTAAAKSAIDRYGVGSTASRLAGGTHRLNLEIETKISGLFGRPSSIIFSTGFGANFAVLGMLGQQHQRIFIDEECHASLYEGAALSGARITRFRHNNVDHLKARFEKYRDEGGQWLVVVDGLYSMSGSVAPLREILALRKDHSFALMVDEAHSFGTVGPRGLGVADALECLAEIDIITGTFSKAIGSIGGFASFNSPEYELLRFLSPGYMYTAALPAANLAAISVALDVSIADGAERRQSLWANCALVQRRLERVNGRRPDVPGPVFSIPVGDLVETIAVWERLFAQGYYVNLILPPASPGNRPLIRFGVSAAHSATQIEGLFDALEAALSA